MKTILLFDLRQPALAPQPLTLDDAVASAMVRAGVAAAANPAEQGVLAAGGALDGGQSTEVVLQVGVNPAPVRLRVPRAVAEVAIGAGVGAAVGTPITGTPTPTPAPTLTSLTVSASSATVGTPFAATISGGQGGAFSLTGPGAPGLSVTGSTISGTPTAAGAVNVTETLAGATNSPRTTAGLVTVGAAVPSTVTYTGAQMVSSIAGGLNTSNANRAVLMANHDDGAWMASVIPWMVTGTKCGIALSQDNPGNQPNGMVEVRVGTGSYQSAGAPVNGYYMVPDGLLPGPETLVCWRLTIGFFTSGLMTTDASTVAMVYGSNPGIRRFSGWTHPGDADGIPHTAQLLEANALGAGWRPAKVTVTGNNNLNDQANGLQILCSEDRIMIAAQARYAFVKFGAAAPVMVDLGPSLPGAAMVEAPAGIAKPYVLTVVTGKGEQQSTGQSGVSRPTMLSVGGAQGMIGKAAVAVRKYQIGFGDSIAHADHNLTSAISHVTRAAMEMGRMPANYGVSGQPISEISPRMWAVLQARTYTSDWHIGYFGGRNSATAVGGDGFTQADQDTLTGDINAFLATAAGRLTMFGLFPVKYPNASSQIEARVTTAANSRVRFQSTAGAGYAVETNPGDATHPSDAGQQAAGVQVAADLAAAGV